MKQTISLAKSCAPLLLLASVSFACSGPRRLTGEALETHLEARIQIFESAMNGSDLDAVMAFFIADPVVSPNGQEFRGAEAVSQVLAQSVNDTAPIDLTVSGGSEGEATFEQNGRYLIDDGSNFGVTGSFTASWIRNAEDEWLISRLSWTQE